MRFSDNMEQEAFGEDYTAVTVIALLDKSFPPSHSFVDGMLASLLPAKQGVFVRLLVSNGGGKPQWRRYLKAVCLPVFLARRGLGRFLNFVIAVYSAIKLIGREKARGRRVVLFVRNDPVYLIAAALVRCYTDKLIFQSSFPHEQTGSYIKRRTAVLLYKAAANRIDAVLAVSPLGVERVRQLFPNVSRHDFIPLMADVPRKIDNQIAVKRKEYCGPTFLYIGTHDEKRALETVIQGIVAACSKGVSARFIFLGGEKADIERLELVPGARELINSGCLHLKEKVPRSEVWNAMMDADVGLCLIPPIPLYLELSPTKLGEYFGCGLAVLGSYGIPLLEDSIKMSNAGVIVRFDARSICDAILNISSNRDMLLRMQQQALIFAKSNLSYDRYLPLLLDLFGMEPK